MNNVTSDSEYKRIFYSSSFIGQYRVVCCSVCGSLPELWEHKERDDTWSKVVMCPNSEAVIEEWMSDSGCPMFMPSRDFYKPTRREAIDVWNKWHEAMTAQRRERLSK